MTSCQLGIHVQVPPLAQCGASRKGVEKKDHAITGKIGFGFDGKGSEAVYRSSGEAYCVDIQILSGSLVEERLHVVHLFSV